MKEQDKYYNWSSFLESYGKIEDVDINPFGGHDKTDSHPDEKVKTFLSNQEERREDLLGNQNVNKKHRLEEGNSTKKAHRFLCG